MRIAIDVSSIVQPSAGVGVYTKKIVNELIKNYQNDTFILFFTSFKKVDLSLLPKGENVIIKNIGWPSKVFNICQVIFSYPKIDNIIKADIFFFPNLQMWRWSSRAKVIMTVHDLSFAVMPWTFSFKMRLWHYFVKPRKHLPLVDKIISVSCSTKNDLISLFGIDSQKIETIYHGIDLQDVGDNEVYEILKKKHSLPDEYLLFVGTLEPRKNLRLLIDALNASTQKKPLVIIGRMGWLKKEDFEIIINNPRIKWLNALSDKERDVLISHCQALVWPSLYEGFGFPPLEATVCSKKVLTGVGGSLSEISGDYSYAFDSTNISNLIVALNNIDSLQEKPLDKEIVKNKYNWHNSAKKLYHIFYETFKNSY